MGARSDGSSARDAADSSDEALAIRSRDGDLAAFESLARRHQERVYSYALRMTGSVHEAEDATQETLLRVFRSLGRFDPQQPFAPWLFGIAAHVCRDALRRRGRRREEPSEAIEPAASGGDPREEAMAAEERRRVRQAVRRLPRKYREVIVLHYAEDMGYEQVAAALGIRPDAARRRALRARLMLQRYLGERER